ncbi:hypothetical protein [Hydrogenophaga sp.]|uniref:hypothetical protein n=1 Tax=Hydrogenophaga sp. TaxID=1904254 RepID=UPI00272B904D|nr:hypothetical protein [Hydrogenophaga sp.]
MFQNCCRDQPEQFTTFAFTLRQMLTSLKTSRNILSMRLCFTKSLAIATAVFLTSCVTLREPDFYPINSTASALTAQPFKARMVPDTGGGWTAGSIEVVVPGGEAYRGRFSIAAGGSVGVSTSMSSVVVPGAMPITGTGLAFGVSQNMKGQGVAMAVSPSGASLQCEITQDFTTFHGFGTCRSTDGAEYRFMY